jgi:NADH-quinone oxidoreductase subunit I
MQAGMLAPPHPMVAGLEERDYYQGKVDTATPEQQHWVEEHHAAEAEAEAGVSE